MRGTLVSLSLLTLKVKIYSDPMNNVITHYSLLLYIHEGKMISIIVAYDRNGCIGRDGKMAWHIPADLKWFKQCTLEHKVVMGRKTYESIGKPLPNRTNIIVTNKKINIPNCLVVNDLEQFLINNQFTDEEIFVIGGANVYSQAIPYASKFYITCVDMEVENGDSFFPKINLEKSNITYHKQATDNYNLDFYIVERTHNEIKEI